MQAISDWLNKLLGRKTTHQPPKTVPQGREKGSGDAFMVVTGSSSGIPDSEDSVKQDMRKLKSFMGKIGDFLAKTLSPLSAKGKSNTSKALTSAGDLIDSNFIKKLLKIFLIFLLILILIFVTIWFVRFVRDGGNNGIFGEPTPTPASYQPYSPSVYAEDEEVLKIEEDLDVLEREVSRTNIRETQLIPPTLDFNISF